MAPIKRRIDAFEQRERPEKKLKASAGKPTLSSKEDAPFPRGGASVLTPLEHKQIKIQAKQDVLFEQVTGDKAPRTSLGDDDDADLTDEELHDQVASRPKKSSVPHTKKRIAAQATQEKPMRIESLSYKVYFRLDFMKIL